MCQVESVIMPSDLYRTSDCKAGFPLAEKQFASKIYAFFFNFNSVTVSIHCKEIMANISWANYFSASGNPSKGMFSSSIVAKRGVYYCFLNTRLELITRKQRNTPCFATIEAENRPKNTTLDFPSLLRRHLLCNKLNYIGLGLAVSRKARKNGRDACHKMREVLCNCNVIREVYSLLNVI